jgi:hypothetical protein
MRAHRSFMVGVAVAVTLATSACASGQAGAENTPTSSESASPTATMTPAPTPTAAGEPASPAAPSYATVEELRTALVAAGATCPSFIEEDTVPVARESATCTGYIWGLSIYDTIEARNSVLAPIVDSLEPSDFLVGLNWLLTTTTRWDHDTEPILSDVQPVVGGALWTYTDPIPTS